MRINYYYCKLCNNILPKRHTCVTKKVAEFESKYYVHKNGCHIWTGPKFTTNDGLTYGYFSFNGKIYPAHRFSYIMNTTWLPDPRYHIHHKCENTLCVNHKHLEPMLWYEHKILHKALNIVRNKGIEQTGIRIWAELVLNHWENA